ncbi:hypothetical protein [Clostridium sp. AF32-12BH]|uniref:hypothetical protein n=1 Tax=Clostridium sp. AF32-12BH TaxID=2292006 RepID=UPI0015FA79FD|nr:hypothetical protein [Clostridium sp. AF32-12BH]
MKMNIAIILAALVVAFFIGRENPTSNYLNMETVNGWESTETGLMLYTVDGSGYYFEK